MAKHDIKASRQYLRQTAFPFWQGMKIYDTVAETTAHTSSTDLRIDPELAAKCADGQALLEERYGITDKTIKLHNLPDESPQALYQKAMHLAEMIPPPRGKAVLAKIGMDYADYLEKSNPVNGFVKAWALRQQLIEKFRS